MPFTVDEHDLERRLPVLLTATNESTALFDAIWLGVNTAPGMQRINIAR